MSSVGDSPVPSSARTVKLRQTFFWKLSVTFFWVSVMLFLAFFLFFQRFWKHFTDKTDQILNWEIAEEYVRSFAPVLSPAADGDAVEQLIYEASLKTPSHEIYVLDGSGSPLFPTNSSPEHRLVKVPIAPIEEFVRQKAIPSNPLYCINPSNPPDGVIFSAAQVRVNEQLGYLLVVLRSHKFGSTHNMVGDLTAFSAVAFFSAVGLLLSLLLGVSMFYLITRRFSQMTSILREFRSGDFGRRLKVVSQDELGEHADTINQMADQIVASLDAIHARDASRRELVAGVAHDLRTPVAVMQIALESLAQEAPELTGEALQSRLRQILRNCESLDMLVTDLFELSKLGAEDFRPQLATVSVEDFVLGMHEQFAAAAEADGLRLTVSEADPSWTIAADPHLLERTVANLLKNALKFTEPGGEIHLAATRQQNGVRLSVRDSGIGIPQNAIANVFDRFYQAENLGKLQHQGTGLGLAIVKKIVELHHSNIQVDSAVGKGTEFSFVLPLQP